MKALKEIVGVLLSAAVGIVLATCVIFTVSFMYIVATGGAQETQDLCADIVEVFHARRAGRR
jgi:hypothetical protein